MKLSNGFNNFEKKSTSSNKIVQKSILDKEFKNLRTLLPNSPCKKVDEVS